MSHHKRRRPKHQRNGCLLCKPHKDERAAKSVRNQRAKAILAESVEKVANDWQLRDRGALG
jgi:hypothetical protein